MRIIIVENDHKWQRDIKNILMKVTFERNDIKIPFNLIDVAKYYLKK